MKSLQFIALSFMAWLMLFSSSTFAMNLHFCGDELAGVSFGDLEMICEMTTHHSPERDDCKFHKKNCCHTQKFIKNGANELQNGEKSLMPHQQVFAAAFVLSYVSLFQEQSQKDAPFKNYIPPLLVKDIHVLHETFLI